MRTEPIVYAWAAGAFWGSLLGIYLGWRDEKPYRGALTGAAIGAIAVAALAEYNFHKETNHEI